jgi:hypothetical protein
VEIRGEEEGEERKRTGGWREGEEMGWSGDGDGEYRDVYGI